MSQKYSTKKITGDVLQAAVRGLKEELGIECAFTALHGPLTPTHDRKLEVAGKFCDAEFVECYRYASQSCASYVIM